MSLFTDLWAAFKKQAARAEDPVSGAQELAQDMADAIVLNQPAGGIYGGNGAIPAGGTVANVAGNSLSFGLALNTGKVKVTDETGATTDLEVSRQPSTLKFDSPNKQVSIEATQQVNLTATDNGAKSALWQFHQDGWMKPASGSAFPTTNPTGTGGNEFFHTGFLRHFRWNGAVWKLREPIYVHLQEVDWGVNVTTGLGKKAFLVPDEWAGLNITEITARCPSGTGEIEIQTIVNGSAGTLMILSNTSAVNVGANRALVSGDAIRVSVTVNTSGLQGLLLTFKIE